MKPVDFISIQELIQWSKEIPNDFIYLSFDGNALVEFAASRYNVDKSIMYNYWTEFDYHYLNCLLLYYYALNS